MKDVWILVTVGCRLANGLAEILVKVTDHYLGFQGQTILNVSYTVYY